MTPLEDDEIYFTVKFLGRIEADQPDGLRILNEAAGTLKMSEGSVASKLKNKHRKTSLFLSISGIDILDHKTKFMLHSCPLSTISFCAVHQTMPNLFGFISKGSAGKGHYCYLFKSTKFSHLLVSIIGEAFYAAKGREDFGGDKDLMVESLRHKNKILQKENTMLKKKIAKMEEKMDANKG
ncbi:PTB domain-containing engulfment adapter protein 1 [Amia ocellicauda]|uniref:PTB domain-containing engulfment adapter protein 1 n=1 Tax=Amia ocellicauda TaxID=2972642 RepID=UPI003464981F